MLEALDVALKNAQAVGSKDYCTQVEVDAAVKELNEAYEAITNLKATEADYQELNKLIQDCESVSPSLENGCETVSLNNYKSMLESAKNTVAGKTATVAMVDEVKLQLKDAFDNLLSSPEQIDNLNKKVAEAQRIESDQCMPEGYETMRSALTTAGRAMSAKEPKYPEVYSADKELEKAINELIPSDNYKAKVKKLVDVFFALNSKKYATVEYEAAVVAANAAKLAAEKNDIKYLELTTVYNHLIEKINGLEKVLINKSALIEAITVAETKQKDAYTAASWESFSNVLAEAKVVWEKADATQEEVNAAVEKLITAQGELKEIVEECRKVLKAEIAVAETRIQSDYTPESWTIFANALATAKTVVVKADATYEELTGATTALKTARSNLAVKPVVPPVVKTALTAAITEAEKLKETDYTLESWKAFADGLTTAKAIAEKAEVTQEEVNKAEQTLKTAQNNLVLKPIEEPPAPEVKPADKTALTTVIAMAEKKQQQEYTAESWTVFANALAAAQKIAAKTEATQEEVDGAVVALTDAQSKLEKTKPIQPDTEKVSADKKDLKAAIAEAEEKQKADYTEETWTAFETALTLAKEIAAKEDATQEEVDKAEAELKVAQNKLVNIPPYEPIVPEVVDKTALTAAITEAETLKETDYTAESWTAFAKALATAKETVADVDASKDAVDKAIVDLTTTRNALSVNTTNQPDETQKPDDAQKPDESQKPEEPQKPAETQKPVEDSKPVETIPTGVTEKEEVKVKDTEYKVVIAGEKPQVSFTETTSKKSTVKIPDTVIINNVVCEVTSIEKNAFKNNKEVKSIKIGKNIESIGKGAFNGCKNLKKITIESKNLKKLGKNALSGLDKNVKIVLPKNLTKKERKKLIKKLRKAGLSKTAKIK